MAGNIPDFLVVGAAKSGTTALTNMLRQHPEIFIPMIKEPRYFAKDALFRMNRSDPQYDFIRNSSILEHDRYYQLFNNTESYTCRGETSVHYLFHHKIVIPKIVKEIGNVKILILLRNPATRALSNYYYMKKETLSMKDALQKESDREKAGYNSFWYYRKLSCYHSQVKAYLDRFSNVKVIIFEDLKNKPHETCRKIFAFLGVAHDFSVSTDIEQNVTRIPKSNFSKRLLRLENTFFAQRLLLPLFGQRLRDYKKKWLIRPNYYQDAELYNSLVELFLDDIIKLEKLLGIDLNHWKNKI